MQNKTYLNELRTVCNAVIQIGDIDDTGKGRHFVSKFIQDGLVKIEGHGIVLLKKETIDQSLQSMVGAPVIIKHQDVTSENADELRCGVISKAYFNDFDGWYYCEGIIWDEKAKELVNKGWSVSCSYDFLAYNDEGGVENNIKYDKEFTQLNFTHLAIVDNPRYERANIVFNCKVDNGDRNRWPAGTEGGKGGQFAPENDSRWQQMMNKIKQYIESAPVEDNDPFAATGHSELLNTLVGKVGYSQIKFNRNKFKDTDNYYAYHALTSSNLQNAYEQFLKGVIDKQGRKSFWDVDGISVMIPKKKKVNNNKELDKMVVNALKQLITVVENKKDGDENGKWVTIKGTHVFIPDGKSVDEVMKEKGMQTSSTGEKDDDELVVVEKADPAAVRKEKEAKSRWDKTMKEYGDLKGKYEREDVEWDEEQLAKDIKAAQDRGYTEVEDIAEFLGLDEDEVRETLAFSGEKKEDGESQLSEIDQKILALKDKENKLLKEFYEAKEGGSTRQYLQSALDTIKERRFKLEDERDGGDGEYKYSAKQLTYGKQYWPKDYQGPVLTFIGEDNGKAYFREGYDAFNREAKKVFFEEGTKFASHETGSNLGKGVNPLPSYMLSSGSESNRQRIQYIKEHGKPSEYENRDINNSKEQDMALLEEIKKLITKVENNKENEEMIENEKVDKRKLIDEVGGILKDKVDEEVWRTIIGKLEKMSYNESEAGTADNKKVKNEDEEKDKKVENEDEKDEKKVEEVEEDVKEDVDNKCKNSKSSFDKINEIYNSVKQIKKETGYVSRQQKLDDAVEYFK